MQLILSGVLYSAGNIDKLSTEDLVHLQIKKEAYYSTWQWRGCIIRGWLSTTIHLVGKKQVFVLSLTAGI